MDGALRRALDGKNRGLTWRLQESLEDKEYADYVCLVSHKYEQLRIRAGGSRLQRRIQRKTFRLLLPKHHAET